MGSQPAANQDLHTVEAAAAVLVLLEGAEVPLARMLAPLLDASSLEAIERRLLTGSRETRARAIAAALARVGLELDRWRIA